jgi:para-nitrobenzyl esterase
MSPPRIGLDCLNLNVRTPDVGATGLPVMVWIHGGGFMTGSGSSPIHDGITWARDGIVHVSINYRMSIDGWLFFGGDTANLGLRDQVAALQWVQDNIAAFGGDPGNVTIFGQSAGAVSVMHLLTAPSAAGLFRRAIAQSGSAMGAEDEVAFHDRVAARLGDQLGVEPTMAGLGAVPMDRLMSACGSLAIEYLSPAFWGAKSFMISAFRPFIDGEVLPEHVVPAVAAGASAGVDVMAGTTRDEMAFAMLPLGLLPEGVPPWTAMALDAFGLTDDDLDGYRKATRPGAPEGILGMAAWTDWAFRIPTIRLLEAHAPQPGRTFGYEFTWPSPAPFAGAVHALEIPFVDDRLADFAAAHGQAINLIGDDAPQSLANAMHAAWIGFATNGDPGWAPYDVETRTTMRFDETSEPVNDLAGDERLMWDGRR